MRRSLASAIAALQACGMILPPSAFESQSPPAAGANLSPATRESSLGMLRPRADLASSDSHSADGRLVYKHACVSISVHICIHVNVDIVHEQRVRLAATVPRSQSRRRTSVDDSHARFKLHQ